MRTRKVAPPSAPWLRRPQYSTPAVAVAFQRCASAVRCTTSSAIVLRRSLACLPASLFDDAAPADEQLDQTLDGGMILGQGHELVGTVGPSDAPRPEYRRRHAALVHEVADIAAEGPAARLGRHSGGAQGGGHLGGEGQRGGLGHAVIVVEKAQPGRVRGEKGIAGVQRATAARMAAMTSAISPEPGAKYAEPRRVAESAVTVS
jgi:hypothetical protein